MNTQTKKHKITLNDLNTLMPCSPAEYYEHVGDRLAGDQAVRAYRAAQSHTAFNDKNYVQKHIRLSNKIIKILTN